MRLSIPCKAGKIQLTDQDVLQIVQPFGKILWQAPAQNITGFAAEPGALTALTIKIYAANDMYVAEIVTRANYEKLQACFPHLQALQAGQPWYLNRMAMSHVATYDNPQQMQREIEAAGMNGWVVAAQSGQGGHVSVKKVIAGGVLFGAAGAIAGAGRSKESITVTFARHPAWRP